MIKKGNASFDSNQDTFDIDGTTVFRNDRSAMLENLLNLIILTISLSLFFIVASHFAGLIGKISLSLLSCALWIGVFFFIYQIIWQKRTVVLSPAGLQDSNVTPETIPWSSVESVRPLSGGLTAKRPWAVMLKLKPGAVDTLRFPRRTRFLRLLRDDELWIAFGFWTIAPGVRLSLDSFAETISAYAKAYGQGIK